VELNKTEFIEALKSWGYSSYLRELDRRQNLEGIRVLYALDSTIISKFCSPTDNDLHSLSLPDFGFRGSGIHEKIVGLARTGMGKILLERARGSCVILDSHSDEFDQRSQEANNEFYDKMGYETLSGIKAQLHDLISSSSNRNDEVSAKSKIVDVIRGLYFPSEKLAMYRDIASNRCVARTKQISAGSEDLFDGEHSHKIADVIKRSRSEPWKYDYSLRRLYNSLRRRNQYDGWVADCRAALQLVWINKEFERIQLPFCMQLITTNHEFIRALRRRYQPWRFGRDSNINLADRFIRSVSYLVNDEAQNEFEQISSDNYNLGHWVFSTSLSLSKDVPPSLFGMDISQFRYRWNKFLNSSIDLDDINLGQWAHEVKSLLENLIQAKYLDKRSRNILNMPKNRDGRQNVLKTWFDQEFSKLSESYSELVFSIQEDLIMQPNSVVHRVGDYHYDILRLLPGVVFNPKYDELKFLEECLSNLLQNKTISNANLSRLKSEFFRFSQYPDYSYFLVVFAAYLSAIRGDYSRCKVLIQQAINLMHVMNQPGAHANKFEDIINGREIYLLASFIWRLDSTRVEDVDHGRKFLKSTKFAMKKADLPLTGIRLSAEMINYDVTDLLYSVFYFANFTVDPNRIQSLVHQAQSALQTADQCKQELARKRAILSLNSSLVSLDLIARKIGLEGISPDPKKFSESISEVFDAAPISLAEVSAFKKPWRELALLLYSYHRVGLQGPEFQAIKQLFKKLTRRHKRLCVLPYDRVRYNFLFRSILGYQYL